MKKMLQQERENRGWTLQYTANKIGITKGALHNLETGQRKPSYDVLVKLLDLFEYKDPRELFAEAPEPPNSSKGYHDGGRAVKRGPA